MCTLHAHINTFFVFSAKKICHIALEIAAPVEDARRVQQTQNQNDDFSDPFSVPVFPASLKFIPIKMHASKGPHTQTLPLIEYSDH